MNISTMPPFSNYGSENGMNMQGVPTEEPPVQEVVPMEEPISDADTLDVAISLGFLRGIFMQEHNRMRDWQQHNGAELDAVKVVVIARNETNMMQADTFITSSPLEKPKPVGDWMNYTALFPLKGSHPPTKMVLPGLIRRDYSNSEFSTHGQFKRESIELLITLIFGNEAITLGRARLVVTGEEVRTKQSDLPIDISKDGILRSQKKSYFPMKRVDKLRSGKDGELAPVSFKYDRRRRKFQIETDAVLRVFYKVCPHDPLNAPPSYPSNMNMSAAGSVSGNQSQFTAARPSRRNFFGGGRSVRSNSPGPRSRSFDFSHPSQRGRPATQPPMTYPYQQSMGRRVNSSSSVYGATQAFNSMNSGNRRDFQNLAPPSSYPPGIQSSPSMPSMNAMNNMMNQMNPSQSRNPSSYGRSPSIPRSINGGSIGHHDGSGSISGRIGQPINAASSSSLSNYRSQSAPRHRYSGSSGFGSGYGSEQTSAYGGSPYGYGGGSGRSNGGMGSGNMVVRGPPSISGNNNSNAIPQYGGSSYGGGPRKMNFGDPSSMSQGFGSQGYGGRFGAGGGGYTSRSRSQSPYVTRNF